MNAAPRRVLMVTGAYFPEISSGGVQCQNMARELAGRADIRVLTTAVDPALPRHDEVDGVPVTRIRVDVRSLISKLRAARRMVLDMFRLAAWCDLVHLHGYSTKNVLVTIIAKMFHKPIVLSLHTAGYDEPQVVEMQGSLALWAFMTADLYLSVSPLLVDAYLSFGMPADRIRLIPNGIDTARFSPPVDRRALRRELGLPEDRPVIVFVGFFSADKQPGVLFEAWQQLHAAGLDTTLMYVGDTESHYFEIDAALKDRMTRTAADAGYADRLRFTGRVYDVERYLGAADVFVLPSRREGLPVALLEAMSCGLPVIASRLPGSTDTIVEDGVNGVLVPTGDVTAFANAIAALLRDRGRAERVGMAARATIEHRYASADIANRWLDAYQLLPMHG